MTKWLMAVGIILLGGALVVPDAEARRMGSGRSVGAQRNVTTPPAQAPAKAAPTQQGAQQAAPAATGSRWGGILGGLALGGLLGYFLGGGGFGGALMGFLLLAGIVFLAIVAFRAFASRRQEHQMQYAGMRETVAVTPQPGSAVTPAVASRIPAGFDAASFLRGAKMNFLKLQAAHDAGRLDEIREFTTTELYEELRKNLNGGQQTDVSGLEAELLELATEGHQHWASVRFSGTVRESPDAAPESFAEVWNLVKPADGSTGWLLAGIQQMH
jgi:predicted lipid-binding transport protein (Tim44 family)